MLNKFGKKIAIVTGLSMALLAGAGMVQASEKGSLPRIKWGFQGPFGTYDRAAMQRGYQVYKEVCSSCHGVDHLAFYHLGEKGGPFYDPEHPNPNDNKVVKALAKDWEVTDIDQDSGDEITRPAIPADKFPKPFPNAIAAAASNGGAVPPDLSVIVSAREGGADYVHGILTEYDLEKEAPEGTYFNAAFPGNKIKMPPPLADGAVEYMDGTEATLEQMSRDVTEFLAWAADPKMEVRKKTGFATMIFLFIFSLLLFMTYKQVWKGVEH